MSESQEASHACGYHGYDENGEPIFDYTCDDCQGLDTVTDPPEL